MSARPVGSGRASWRGPPPTARRYASSALQNIRKSCWVREVIYGLVSEFQPLVGQSAAAAPQQLAA